MMTFDKTLTVVLLNANDGSLYNYYTIGSYSSASFYKQSLAIDASNVVYLAAYSSVASSGWMVFSFQT